MEEGVDTKDPNTNVRRPMNAFLIFCKRHRSLVREKNPQLDNRSVTRILGELWANMPPDEKSAYTSLAKEYKEAFLKANPDYKWFNPEKHHQNSPNTKNHPKTTNTMTSLNQTPPYSMAGLIEAGKLAEPGQMGGLNLLLMAGQQALAPSSDQKKPIESQHEMAPTKATTVAPSVLNPMMTQLPVYPVTVLPNLNLVAAQQLGGDSTQESVSMKEMGYTIHNAMQQTGTKKQVAEAATGQQKHEKENVYNMESLAQKIREGIENTMKRQQLPDKNQNTDKAGTESAKIEKISESVYKGSKLCPDKNDSSGNALLQLAEMCSTELKHDKPTTGVTASCVMTPPYTPKHEEYFSPKRESQQDIHASEVIEATARGHFGSALNYDSSDLGKVKLESTAQSDTNRKNLNQSKSLFGEGSLSRLVVDKVIESVYSRDLSAGRLKVKPSQKDSAMICNKMALAVESGSKPLSMAQKKEGFRNQLSGKMECPQDSLHHPKYSLDHPTHSLEHLQGSMTFGQIQESLIRKAVQVSGGVYDVDLSQTNENKDTGPTQQQQQQYTYEKKHNPAENKPGTGLQYTGPTQQQQQQQIYENKYNPAENKPEMGLQDPGPTQQQISNLKKIFDNTNPMDLSYFGNVPQSGYNPGHNPGHNSGHTANQKTFKKGLKHWGLESESSNLVDDQHKPLKKRKALNLMSADKKCPLVMSNLDATIDAVARGLVEFKNPNECNIKKKKRSSECDSESALLCHEVMRREEEGKPVKKSSDCNTESALLCHEAKPVKNKQKRKRKSKQVENKITEKIEEVKVTTPQQENTPENEDGSESDVEVQASSEDGCPMERDDIDGGLRKSRRSNRGKKYQELLAQGVLQTNRTGTRKCSETSASGNSPTYVKEESEDSGLPQSPMRHGRKRTVSEADKHLVQHREGDLKRFKTGDFDLEAHIATLPTCHNLEQTHIKKEKKKTNSSTPSKIRHHSDSSTLPRSVQKTEQEGPQLNVAQLHQWTRDHNGNEKTVVEPAKGSQKRKARKKEITHLIQMPPGGASKVEQHQQHCPPVTSSMHFNLSALAEVAVTKTTKSKVVEGPPAESHGFVSSPVMTCVQ